ncbi:MAG: TraB/GumN family protein [Kofleriaceae bacterium]|nr:TraB/GumN family protein [Kofleriaceae bacterium]MBP6840590.1 TraB/GumN family protein [Kofleriaceae bacterium]MBP9207370.1 TraB/GumN family protein [Kofleriaceae bacterium]
MLLGRTWSPLVVVMSLVLAMAGAGCKDKGKGAGKAPGPGSNTPTAGSAAATAPADARPAPAGPATPILFTVSKDGKTSHLLGTIDAGFDITAQLPPSVWTLFDGARAVVLEWNLLEVTMPMLRRTDGKKLSDDLSPAELSALEAAVGKDWVAQLADAKPSFVAAVLSARGLSTRNPMQPVLAARAEDKKVQIVFLESGAAQQERMDTWLDLGAVRALLADPDLAARNGKLVDAFTRGDLVTLASLREERMPWKTAGKTGDALAALDRATLDDRHVAWLPTLTNQLGEGGAFIAVDAMHLPGDKGLVAVLERAGFVVTRVP